MATPPRCGRPQSGGLNCKVTGLGVWSTNPPSGNVTSNLALPGATLDVFSMDPATGERRGAAAYGKTIGPDGQWSPFAALPATPCEFVIAAPGYATTQVFRSPFPRSSNLVNLRPERVADADKNAPAKVTLTKPRGYFDPAGDKMAFDGQSPPP